jgi:hypothetical protein
MKALVFAPCPNVSSEQSSMMYFLLMGSLVASSVAAVIVLIRMARRRPHQHSGLSTEQLGTVSQQWLTTHRAER